MKNVLVYAGQAEGKLTRSALEALSFGRKLAGALGESLEAVVVGADVANTAAQAIAAGAQKVYQVENPILTEYQPDLYVAAITAAAKQADPHVLLLSLDFAGPDLLPRIAHRLNAAVLTEIIGFTLKNGELNWTRPVYGGKAFAVYSALRERQVIGLRAKTEDPAPLEEGRSGEIVKVVFSIDEVVALTRIVEKVQEAINGIRLTDARIVVAGGRGMGGSESFEDLKELADLLGGAVGASRAACDAGWISPTWQVGQTGTIIAPDLYFAIGISGASQHLAGITSAKNVIAINKDAEAPIFKRANLGIVADYKTVLSILTEGLKKVVSK